MTLTDELRAFSTHQVSNQSVPLSGFDPLACDPALGSALTRYAVGDLTPLALEAGSAEAREHGRLADENPPQLRTHDRYGNRIDEVEYHPSWHWLMERAIAHGLHAAPWGQGPGAHLRRAAGFYLWSQAEAGHGCPISMTYSSVPALRWSPELAAEYEPKLTAPGYEFGLRPPQEKSALLAGMSMTEKQGGSDVRTNTTTAEPLADGTYRLVGHKWFTSAPMNDLFLTLAQTANGVSCFLVPRVLPDGSRNEIRLQRLKDKLGNKSNASSEIEYTGAIGHLVGEEGRGVRCIIEMVSMTRLDCVLGAAANVRIALSEAAHHVQRRSAFGARLADQPLMQQVIADLALESEAATTLAMRLAAAVEQQEHDLLRLALPATKFFVCKRAPYVVAEALECLGGNGYVEESGMPRLYREAPLMSIWEGSGNVTALDLLRALAKQPSSRDAILAELDAAGGDNAIYDGAVRRVRAELADPRPERARALAESLALTLQAALLQRYAPATVSDAFIATRLGDPGRTFGATPIPSPKTLVDRIAPGR